MFEDLFSLASRRSRNSDGASFPSHIRPDDPATDGGDTIPLRGAAAHGEMLAAFVAALALDQVEAAEAAVPEPRRSGLRALLARPFRALFAGKRDVGSMHDIAAAAASRQADASSNLVQALPDGLAPSPSAQQLLFGATDGANPFVAGARFGGYAVARVAAGGVLRSGGLPEARVATATVFASPAAVSGLVLAEEAVVGAGRGSPQLPIAGTMALNARPIAPRVVTAAADAASLATPATTPISVAASFATGATAADAETAEPQASTSSNSMGPTTNAVAAGSAPLPVFGGTQKWNGGTADWYAANWTSQTSGVASGYPTPGQAAVVASGTAILNGSEGKTAGTFDSNAVTLGSSSGSGATLMLNSAVLGATFNVTTAGTASILASGTSVFQATLFATSGTSLTLGSVNGGNLIFNQINVTTNTGNNDAYTFVGTTTVEESGYSFRTTGAVTVDGTINLIGGTTSFDGAVSGNGGLNLGLGSIARFGVNSSAGSVAAGLNVHFSDVDGIIELGSPTTFGGTITNFQAGDSIDFRKITGATAATFDTNAHQLTLRNGSSTLATLNNVYGNAGSLSVATSPDGGTRVSFAGATSAVNQGAAASAVALGATTVQSTLRAPGTGQFVTGAGIKIGIISDSFNTQGGANAAAAAGFLPETAQHTSAVTVVKEGSKNNGGTSDEGQAMAEAIYQDAPGAQLYFASATYSYAGFADSVQQLRNAGCQIIVDDVGYLYDANDQIIGPVATAAQGAVAGGVNYFTSAGNEGHSFISMPFAPQTMTLPDGSQVSAAIFSNGTPYEPITVTANTTAILKWAAPFVSPDGSSAPNALTFKVFSTSGTLSYTSHQDTAFDSNTVGDAVSYTGLSAGNYFVSVYSNSGTPVPASFSFQLINNGTEQVINDPLAGNTASGIGTAQEIVPGVNTVGAVYYGQSPTYGVTTAANETFSEIGSNQLLFDANGNALSPPQTLVKPNFSAPDGQYSTSLGYFYGTSAAAPNAAAVAALMLQADSRLTTTQVSYLLAQTATSFGNDAAQSGAGLIQAVPATQAAITAATTPIWTAQDGSTNWSDAANWSDDAVPGTGDTAQVTNGIGALLGAYSVTYDPASSTIAGLTIDGGSTSAPTLAIGAGHALAVTGAVNVADNSTLAVTGTVSGGAFTIGAGSTLSFAADASVTDTSLTLSGGTLEETTGFASTRTVVVANGTVQIDAGSATLSGAVSGAALTKTGAGTLILSGRNKYTGGTTVDAGTLSVASDDSLGDRNGAVSLTSGTLEEATGFASNRAIITTKNTFATVQVDGGTARLSGTISGDGTLQKQGAGTLVVSGTNTYGGVAFEAGTLSASSDSNLGASGGGAQFNGGTLEETTGFSSNRQTLFFGYGGGTFQIDQGTATWAGAILGGSAGLTKTGTGTLALTNNGNDYAGTTIAAGALDLSYANTASSASISFEAMTGQTATLDLETSAQNVNGTFANALADFADEDVLDLYGFADGFVDPLAAPGTLVVRNLAGQVETFTLSGNHADVYTARTDGNGGTIVEDVTCYVTGTRIRTARGDVAVEDLRVGDLAVTVSGEHRPIRWIGSRLTHCRRHLRSHEAMPVRVAAHAFAPNRPARDLLLSPGHSLCVDVVGEVLIPAIVLVNGTTITQEDVDHVTYWHVELEGGHDILLAENMPAESYLDMGNRGFFAEADVVALDASPDAPVVTHADFCRPFHVEGALVEVVRAQLAARAENLGWRLEEQGLGDLHLLVDGVRIEPQVRGLSARFTVPAGAEQVWLVSGTAVPAEIAASTDRRSLGVCVAALTLDDGFGTPLALTMDDPRLCVGFHAVERDGDASRRWTAGRARLPASLWDGLDDDVFLRVDLAGPALPRWVAPAACSPVLQLSGSAQTARRARAEVRKAA